MPGAARKQFTGTTLAWTSILLMPFAVALICVHYLQTPVFRGQLLPPQRWDEFRRLASDWPFYFRIAGWFAAGSVVVFVLDAIRRGMTTAARSVGFANMWMLVPLAALIAFETWRAYGVRYLGADLAAHIGEMLVITYPMFISIGIAGLLAAVLRATFGIGGSVNWKWSIAVTGIAVVAYAVTFSTLSILQYRALHVPHGDSGMYEEHLWNVLHGKGFRSELDSGRLFLGERFQIIHLLLIPVYWLKPSLLTLNVCESVALSSTAIAVWWMARTLRLPSTAATLLAVAALTYFPLQSLDQEQSWKTFRPNSFGVPLIAFALASLEAGRLRLCLGLLAASFMAAEDYSLIAAGIGVYVACGGVRQQLNYRVGLAIGLTTTVVSLLFLIVVMTVVIPYFRGGAPPHYTPYFKSLGSSPVEIVRHVVTQPRMVFSRLATLQNAQLFLLLLGPVAMVPLLSPMRLLASAPVLGFLMLGEREGMNEPFFHFHGPVVAVVLWATVGGVANLGTRLSAIAVARFVLGMTLATGIWYGPSPLSWKFFDPTAAMTWQIGDPIGATFRPAGHFWRDRYLAPERAAAFDAAIAVVKPDERVAATDYIRTRFTHFGACHEYPPLKDHVSIDDIDVLVLDLAEGYWGKGSTNVDRELLATARRPGDGVGTKTMIRGKPGQPARQFEVVYRDRWFLAARRLRTPVAP